MKYISLFSGIGGMDLGLDRAGFECVVQVEIDEFCRRVLAKHWPDVPKYKDVRDVNGYELSPAELVVGGFPCQDVSLAGERKGLKGKRSTLWSEFYRIVCEVRPRWVVIENVTGLLSSDNGQFFTKILRELSEVGYDAEWQIVPAGYLGADHLRERVFILAYPNGIRLEGNYNHGLLCNKALNQGNARQMRSSLGENSIESLGINRESAIESNFLRVVNDVPPQVDRLKSLGNAVVPVVAEVIGIIILEAEAGVV